MTSEPTGTPRIAPGGLRQIGPGPWVFSRLAGRRMGTTPPAVFTTLGRTRGLFWGWLHFASGLMPFGKLPRRESELVILRVATLAHSAYELSHHRRLGRAAGLTTEEIDRVAAGPDAPGWSDRDRMLLTATDELHHTRDLSDQTWVEVRRHLDERRSIELLMLAGHYEMLATALHTLRLEPDPKR